MLPLRATRPRLFARRFILAYASTSSHKSVHLSPFYFPSSIFSSSLTPLSPLLDIIALVKSPHSALKPFYFPTGVRIYTSPTTSLNFRILD